MIAEICRTLDGLPLAIELAAARISHLKPAVLLERLVTPLLNAPLDTLGRGASDLPARQLTMRDTIASSYDLLSPLEQSLLCRLSIFDGDCSLEAIEAVCSEPEPDGSGGAGLDGASLLNALAALVDLRSRVGLILRARSGPAGRTRGGSSGIFGYTGGQGASSSPVARSRVYPCARAVAAAWSRTCLRRDLFEPPTTADREVIPV